MTNTLITKASHKIMEIVDRHGENTSESGIYWFSGAEEDCRKEVADFLKKELQNAIDKSAEEVVTKIQDLGWIGTLQREELEKELKSLSHKE